LRILILALLACLVLGPASAETLIEAELYLDGTETHDRLGDTAGDLYICNRGSNESGPYLLLVTDAAELDRTWAWNCSRVAAGVNFTRLGNGQSTTTRRVTVTH